MNATRRKQIAKVQKRLQEIKSELETIQQDEQNYADNIPENMNGNKKHEKAEGSAQYLQEAVDSLDEIDAALASAVE